MVRFLITRFFNTLDLQTVFNQCIVGLNIHVYIAKLSILVNYHSFNAQVDRQKYKLSPIQINMQVIRQFVYNFWNSYKHVCLLLTKIKK